MTLSLRSLKGHRRFWLALPGEVGSPRLSRYTRQHILTLAEWEDDDWLHPERWPAEESPERRLWLAVLEQALEDLAHPRTCRGRRMRAEQEDARAFLLGDGEEDRGRREMVCAMAGVKVGEVEEVARGVGGME